MSKTAKFQSQFGQDQFIYEEVLNKQEKGFFLDIGASEPIALNNTIFFERLGWNGIAIEPMKEVYDDLVKHRKCICENVAISSTNEVRKFLSISGKAQMLSGLLEGYDVHHLFGVITEVIAAGEANDRLVSIIDMSCVTLASLLEKHRVEHVDYMSLDVEGKELDILKTIDFDAVNIRCMSVENNNKAQAIEPFMISKGYTKVRDIRCDEIYHRE